MRYNVHPPRAFRNRIAKYLGVLVAAALIATLGLPSAAQAQTIPDSCDPAASCSSIPTWLHGQLDDSAANSPDSRRTTGS